MIFKCGPSLTAFDDVFIQTMAVEFPIFRPKPISCPNLIFAGKTGTYQDGSSCVAPFQGPSLP